MSNARIQVFYFIIILLFANISISQNLLTNGDFESGGNGVGFNINGAGYSEILPPFSGNTSPGNYAFTNNPQPMNTGFFIAGGDHTTGTGRMMVIDGNTTGGAQRFWRAGNTGGGVCGLTIGATYTFSYWIKSVATSCVDVSTLADIGIQINNASNITLASGSTTAPLPSNWQQVIYTFQPTNSCVNIELWNNNTNPVGNDFAVDDFSLTAPPTPLRITSSFQNLKCYNSNDGSIIAYAQGGVLPYQNFSISGPVNQTNTTGIFTNLPQGNYTLVVTDSNGNSVQTIVPLTSPPQFSAGSDLNICAGETVVLQATGGGLLAYSWTSTPTDVTMTSPSSANTFVTPSQTTTYTVTHQTNEYINLVTNGDFSNGNEGFYSEYNYYAVNSGNLQKAYGVVSNPNAWEVGFSPSCVDHTNSTGLMFVADGSTSNGGNDVVWGQKIVVEPNKNYDFSFWVQTIASNNPATLRVTINGTNIGFINAPNSLCNWINFSQNWNSGTATLADIKIYNSNTTANGNDFALDDISFSSTYLCNLSDSVTVIVVQPLQPTINCQVTSSSSLTFTWNPLVGASQYNVSYTINGGAPISGGTIATTNYTVSGLSGSNTVQITVTPIGTECYISGTQTCSNATTCPTPIVTIDSQPSCLNPTGSITVSIPNTQNELFISEVTDHEPGALTYIEIFNGTGAPKNLSNYKIKIYNNGNNFTSCEIPLVGTLNNNDVFVVAVGSTTNQGGVIPDLVVASCAGINNNDNIRLTSSTDVEIDNWGRNDGVIFTPLGLPGYTYRRNTSAIKPSMIWNPSDWTEIDPQDYTNVGSYNGTTSTYEYSVNNGSSFQSSPTFTGLNPGNYTVVIRDIISGCVSNPISVTINNSPSISTPLISTTAPTCSLSGSSSIVNYDATLTYVFNPLGPTIGTGGLISGMIPNTSYTVTAGNGSCTSSASASFTNLSALSTIPVPIINVTAPTCLANGSATITNYVAGLTYTFDPVGPSVDGTGLISGMTFGTSYVVSAGNGSCSSLDSSSFVVNAILPTPVAPIVNVTAPTCTADGFSTITNYDATLTYTFNPTGPTIDASGLVQGMVLGTSYEVTSTNASSCTSPVSNSFVNNPMLATPAVPTILVTAPTCLANGSATITNYVAGLTYTFDPVGPSVDGTGLISGMTLGTNYMVSARNATCTSANSVSFSISQQLPQPTIVSVTNNGPICVGSTATFTINATPNTQVTYSVNGNPAQTVAITTSGVGVVNVAGVTGSTTLTTVSVFDGICSANVALNSTVNLFADTTIALISAPSTANQSRCAGVTLDPIQYQVTGTATGVSVTGLPTGVTHSYNAATGLLTISGATNVAGVSNFSITTTGGCNPQATASGSITITGRPVLNYTVTNTVCDGSTLNFALSSNIPNTTYSWSATVSNISGFYNTTTNGDELNINNVVTLTNPETIGTITMVIIPRANGCDGIPQTVIITVNPNPVVEVVAVADTSVCSATSATNNVQVNISGNISGITYNWTAITNGVTVVGGTTSGTITATSTTASFGLQVITSDPLVAGTIYFEVSAVRNGCVGNTLQSAVVTVNPNPGVAISSPDKTICSGDPTDLMIDVSPLIAGTEIEWEVLTVVNVSGANPGSGIAPQPINDVLTSTTGGYVIYRVRTSLGECEGTYTDYRVNVNPAPLPILADGNICITADGEVYQTYTLNTGLNNTDYDFEWFDSNGNIIPGETNATLVVDAPGTYSVIATNWLTGCSSDPTLSTATATVTETMPATTMTVVQSEYFSDNATITVNVTGGTGTLMYSLDEGPLQSSNVFTGVSVGEHLVTVVDTEGCTYMTQEVTIIDYPNYFTPNGDGINDTWNISGLNQPGAKLYIFDRYGKLLKQLSATEGSDGWDGTYNQEQLPSTDYWFTLDYMENGVAKTFKAHFTMKR